MSVKEDNVVAKKPNRIIWLLNERCNLKCKFCYVAGRFGDNNGLKLSEIIKALDDLIELGIKRIDFTGGEVLLREDILTILEEARKRGIQKVTINTNGTLVSKKIAEVLAKNNVEVYLSIDGATRETHESIRGIGTWDKALKAVELFKSFDVKFYTVFACSKINAGEVTDYIALSKELGSSKACIIPVLPVGRATKEIILGKEELMEILYRIEDTAKSIKFSTEVWCVPFAGLIINSPYVSFFGCRTMDEMDITPTGDVLVCDTVDVSFGNIREGVAKVWRKLIGSELALGLLKTVESPPCNSCSIKELCYGGCYARAKFLSNNIYSPDPMCPRVVSF
ncbi:MAG: radical SAM/SPASM domain-containing protein [bacterium]